jgi:hypothetical protein
VDAGSEHAQKKDSEAKQQKAASLAAALSLPAICCRVGLPWHGVWSQLSLWDWLVGEEVDAKLEIRALELGG